MIRVALTILCLLASASPNAGDVRVAVASNFAHTLKTLIPAFEQQTGHRVNVSSASSGKLYAQILHGAPFDVFLSADTDKPAQLAERYPDIASSQFTYATGRLVLWCPSECEHPLTDLKNGRYRVLAMANPRVAPYGHATQEALQHLNIDDGDAATSAKVVLGENIGQTWRFIDTGNATLGFIALSQARQQHSSDKDDSILPESQYWSVPATMHSPLSQSAVLTQQGLANPAAKAFREYLLSAPVQAQIQQQGYDPVYE